MNKTNYKFKQNNHWDAEVYIVCFLSEALRAGTIKGTELKKIKEILLKMADAGTIVQGTKLSDEVRKIQIAFKTDSSNTSSNNTNTIEDSVVIETDKKNLIIPKEEVVQNPLSINSTLKLNVTEN